MADDVGKVEVAVQMLKKAQDSEAVVAQAIINPGTYGSSGQAQSAPTPGSIVNAQA